MEQVKYIESLKKIRNAYLLLFFSINLGTIDILPNWLAFIFISQSINEIGKEEESALLLKGINGALIAYHIIVWTLKIFSISIDHYLIVVFFVILQLYVTFQLMSNIVDISIKHQSAYTNKLRSVRNMVTILFTFETAFFGFPIPEMIIESGFVQSILVFGLIIWGILSIIQIVHINGYISEEKQRA